MRRDQVSRSVRVETQVKRASELYSQIGEPLPVDVIIDLYRCLGQALEAVSPEKRDKPRLWHGRGA